MASSRIRSLTKLTLLLGVPIALLLGLFGGGVYCGSANREAILGFERDWLGMDVALPATSEPVKSEPVKPEPAKPEPTPEPVKPEPVTTPEPPKPTPEPTPVVDTTPKPMAAALTTVTDPVPLTLASPLPLPDDLHARMAEPVRIRVKVLVDPEIVDRRPDWIAYVQRHVVWASEVLEKQIGVRLELRGVVVWSSPEGSSATARLADLQRRSRDGSDLLLGFPSQAFNDVAPAGATPEFNAGFALVQVNPASRAPHLRGLLRAVGESLGAAAITDPGSDASRTGSFMAEVRAADSQPIALDADSRRRMLEHKSLPFQVSVEAPPSDDGEL
jgi:hypothetical protein